MPDHPLCKEFVPNTNLKPPLAEFKTMPSCLTDSCLGEETNPHLATTSFQVVVGSDEVTPEPPLLQAKQTQLCQPLLIRFVFQSLHQPCCPSLDLLQHLNILPELSVPELNTLLKVWPHQRRVQEKNHFPGPVGHTVADTGQDAIGLLGHQGTLLAHVQPSVKPNPQVPFHLVALQPLCAQPVALHGVVVSKVQDPAFGLIELHPVGISSSLHSFQVPLQSPPAFQQVDNPSQLGVICKLAHDGLNSLI
ncbi:hypothetical protein WISP_17385 [Willisornis vidua]|uniref:Uncharacterized protein n=1 Tax=Willisornis vidua TaxID=1566151 RepID=A0ABQ9DSI2_9PASS|nr:hypothetical protein WISP_17385 [Willisornis vidua]